MRKVFQYSMKSPGVLEKLNIKILYNSGGCHKNRNDFEYLNPPPTTTIPPPVPPPEIFIFLFHLKK